MSTPTDPLTLGITSDIGAVATFLGKCVDFGLDIEKVLNSPQMIQARVNAAAQRQRDQNAKDADTALKTGDVTKVEEDLSP
jgi:hypothetical protein